MSPITDVSGIHRWVDRLDAVPERALQELGAESGECPPTDEVDSDGESPAVEAWLRDVVAPRHLIIAAGKGKYLPVAEVRARHSRN